MNLFRRSPGRKLKILFIAAEAAPFASVGGLASVMYSLPKALNRLGHDARVFIPRYVFIDNQKNNLIMENVVLQVPTGRETATRGILVCNVKRFDETKDSKSPVTTYFLENQEYFELRANVYGYNDDIVRWALLSRGALEFISYWSEWKPDIIVSSDWQTGLVPNYMKTLYKDDPVISKITSVFSIHNLFYQAMYDHHFVSEMDYDHGESTIPAIVGDPRLVKINPMRRGIMYADAITTALQNYAKEILTKEFGELVDDLLRERRGVLSGILNGIDYEVWNPKTDKNISVPYDVEHIEERAKNKVVLQERFGLEVNKNMFVLAIVSRLAKQKGFDLLKDIMDTLLRELPVQLVEIGDGESELMNYFKDLAAEHPGRVAAHLQFDSVLPHVVYAGADALLMPSRFEPCGLAQMEAMRMGTDPSCEKSAALLTRSKITIPLADAAQVSFSKGSIRLLSLSPSSALTKISGIRKRGEHFRNGRCRKIFWDQSAKRYAEVFSAILDKKDQKKI